MLQNSKTIHLINTLDDKNIKAILKDKNIAESQKKMLSYCLRLIKKNVLEKEKLFELYYKENYNSKKDFLLRNELRKLNETLENFVAFEYSKKEIEKDFYTKKRLLCLHLIKKQEFSLLDKELNIIFAKIDENEDYQFFSQFVNIWYLYKYQQQKYSLNYFDEIINFIKNNYYKWELEVAGKTKLIELYNTHVKRTKVQITGILDFDNEIEKIDFKNTYNKTNYLNYLRLKEKSYKTYGTEKIELLKETLNTLKKVKNNTINQNSENFFILQMIGVEYMILKDYVNAQKFLKESIKIKMNINDMLFIKGLFNYISVEIFLKKYNLAIELYLENKKSIDDSELKYNYACTLSMCGILDNQIEFTETIHHVIPSKLSIKLHLYSRLTESILYYLRNEIDLCLNELNNCAQTINYHKMHEITSTEMDFIKFFKQFVNTQQINNTQKEKKSQLKNLSKNLQIFISEDSNKIQSNNSLHILWLVKNIETSLSQT